LRKIFDSIWVWIGGTVITHYPTDKHCTIPMTVTKRKIPSVKRRLQMFLFPWTKKMGVPWYSPWAEGIKIFKTRTETITTKEDK